MLQISGIWADVMRMGLQRENHQPDAEWWIEHQKKSSSRSEFLLASAWPDESVKGKMGPFCGRPHAP
jgi:hypothetical protein